jgi:hypothetical protein
MTLLLDRKILLSEPDQENLSACIEIVLLLTVYRVFADFDVLATLSDFSRNCLIVVTASLLSVKAAIFGRQIS